VFIFDQKVKMLQNQAIGLVKVQWTYYGPEDETWDHDDSMQSACIFSNTFEILIVHNELRTMNK
jgi:hypothetical protein